VSLLWTYSVEASIPFALPWALLFQEDSARNLLSKEVKNVCALSNMASVIFRAAEGSRNGGEGEVGCLFDEIQNLVEPTERPHTDVRAGPQRGRMPERRGPNSPAHRRRPRPVQCDFTAVCFLEEAQVTSVKPTAASQINEIGNS
jgi:hypothetical protein